jgi:integrative and conjugative element protein (TIGR02256 family)
MWRVVSIAPNKGIVMLHAAIQVILQESMRTRTDGLETGGILLGHEARPKDVSPALITSAGLPGPNALRRPDRFLRDLDYSSRLSAAAWDSDGSQWIGDWHTHRSGQTVPSATDMQSYASLLDDDELHFHQFITIIAIPGRTVGTTRLGAWTVDHRGAAATDLTVRGKTIASAQQRTGESS